MKYTRSIKEKTLSIAGKENTIIFSIVCIDFKELNTLNILEILNTLIILIICGATLSKETLDFVAPSMIKLATEHKTTKKSN
jgi:hypothetical protein